MNGMKPTNKHPFDFLVGGGEMGRLIRSKDWAKTTLGEPDEWPQNLKTTLSLLLNSRFPMFLFWGSDLVCFYNDGPDSGDTQLPAGKQHSAFRYSSTSFLPI
jgi:hypothetical protein